METLTIVPSVSLVINLSATSAEQFAAGARFFAPLLGKLALPATWVVDEPRQAKMLAERQLAPSGCELALTVAARTPQRLRTELADLQAAVYAISGHKISVVAGDPEQLRSRAALLADLGIAAVVSGSQQPGPAKPPRLLPCGLWQFDPAMTLPQPRHRWSWLTARRSTLRRLLAAETSGDHKVVAIDLAQASDRDLQGYEQLLHEIADGSRQQPLRVATVRELAAELASQREVQPQRSILRRAA